MKTLLTLGAWLACAAALAQSPAQSPAEAPQLTGARGNAQKRLTEVEAALAAGRAQEAADSLRRLLSEAGDQLVSRDGRHYQPVRVVSAGVLARLPAAERQAWRERTGAPAAADLARARQSPAAERLEAVATDYPLTDAADEALKLAGDLAFHQGEFRAAETYWRRRATPPAARDRAQLALAVLLQGRRDDALRLIQELRQTDAQAAGPLAGRDGPYAETLARLAESPPGLPPPAASTDWTTLGGNAARTGHAAGELARSWPARPTWVMALDRPGEPVAPDGLAPVAALRRHPVTCGDTGYVADANSVVAFDLRTGARRGGYAEPAPADGADLSGESPLTVVPAEGLLFARLGPSDVTPPPARNPAAVVCLKLTDGALRPAYRLTPPVPEGVAAAWEAAPVWSDGRVFAAFVREADNRTLSGVACYAAASGELLWTAGVAEVGVGGRAERRTRPEPLAVGGGRVYYGTQSGFVVALSEATGQALWAHAYPKAERPTPEPRAIGSLLFEGGRVFCAPTDADRLLALDAVSGELLWEVVNTQTEQFLGITQGQLVAAVAAPVRGIRGYDLATGSHRLPTGFAVHDDPQLAGFGRGLVTQGAVVWPTRAGVFFLRPGDGSPLPPRLPGAHGHLAATDDVLIVATPTEVWGYVRDPGLPRFAPPPRSPAQQMFDWLVARPPGGGPAAVQALSRAFPGYPESRDAIVVNADGVPARLGTAVEGHALSAPPPEPKPERVLEGEGEPGTALGGDVAVERVTRLPTAGCRPLLAFGGESRLPALEARGGWAPLLLVADRTTLYALPPRDPTPVWRQSLPPGVVADRALAVGARVLVAGPRGCAAFSRATGAVEWNYPHPEPLPDLFDPQFHSGRLVLRVGLAQRLCLNAETGDILWGRDGRGDPRLGPDAPADADPASPIAEVAGEYLTQVAPGLWALLSRQTGEWLATGTTYPTPWPQPAVRIAQDRVAYPESPGLVRAVEVGGPTRRVRSVWEYKPGRPTSLTGRMPQLKLSAVGLVVAVERGHANELALVTVRGGTPLWPRVVRLPPGPLDLVLLSEDRDRLYLVVDRTPHCVRVADGRIDWSGGRLSRPPLGLFAGSRGVAVVTPVPPEEPFSATRLLTGVVRNQFVATLIMQLDAISTAGLEVTVLDPETGRARGAVTIRGGFALWELTGNAPVVVTPGVAHWLSGGR